MKGWLEDHDFAKVMVKKLGKTMHCQCYSFGGTEEKKWKQGNVLPKGKNWETETMQCLAKSWETRTVIAINKKLPKHEHKTRSCPPLPKAEQFSFGKLVSDISYWTTFYVL